MSQGPERKSVHKRRRLYRRKINPPNPNAPILTVYWTAKGGLIHARCKTALNFVRTEATDRDETHLYRCATCLETVAVPQLTLNRLGRAVWFGEDAKGASEVRFSDSGRDSVDSSNLHYLRLEGSPLPSPAADLDARFLGVDEVTHEDPTRPCRTCGVPHLLLPHSS